MTQVVSAAGADDDGALSSTCNLRTCATQQDEVSEGLDSPHEGSSANPKTLHREGTTSSKDPFSDSGNSPTSAMSTLDSNVFDLELQPIQVVGPAPSPALFQQVLLWLPLPQVVAMRRVNKIWKQEIDSCKARLLKSRRIIPTSDWWFASMLDQALYHVLVWEDWKSGPNVRTAEEGNAVTWSEARERYPARSPLETESLRGESSTIQLSQGTDWKGFQGIYRIFPGKKKRLYPTWLSYDVLVGDVDVGGAYFCLGSKEHTWGVQRCIFWFACQKKRWEIQPESTVPGRWQPVCDAVANQWTKIAVRFDWNRNIAELFIDGYCKYRFSISEDNRGIKVMCIYNWRNTSVACFKNLVLGNVRPIEIKGDYEPGLVPGMEIRYLESLELNAHMHLASSRDKGRLVKSLASMHYAAIVFLRWLLDKVGKAKLFENLFQTSPFPIVTLIVFSIFLMGYTWGLWTTMRLASISETSEESWDIISILMGTNLYTVVGGFTAIYGILVALGIFYVYQQT